MRHVRAMAVLAALLLGGMACEGDETGPTDHTPVDAALYDATGAELTPDITLTAGATLRVEVRFLDAHGDVITGLEDDHHTVLTFAPATLATADTVPGMRFFRDLTVSTTPGGGRLHIGYGHSLAGAEETFGPFTVTVQ